MEKWADYCISAVSYSEDPKHIKEAKVHKDKGGTIGPGKTWSRSQIVSSIESEHSFITILRSEDGKFERGEDVHVIKVNGKEYIRTDKNEIKEDNLGDLPEY